MTDKGSVQEGFSPSEGDAASCGLEIKVIDLYPVIELPGTDHFGLCLIKQLPVNAKAAA
jgi:hypothetical protein